MPTFDKMSDVEHAQAEQNLKDFFGDEVRLC